MLRNFLEKSIDRSVERAGDLPGGHGVAHVEGGISERVSVPPGFYHIRKCSVIRTAQDKGVIHNRSIHIVGTDQDGKRDYTVRYSVYSYEENGSMKPRPNTGESFSGDLSDLKFAQLGRVAFDMRVATRKVQKRACSKT